MVGHDMVREIDDSERGLEIMQDLVRNRKIRGYYCQ